ncbi:unnamed protein product [Ambrosiozyma monospora]|uniref:Unnamed protein product n=1 Tax=Ambrosiozyma monospora TaxID=43982 RepID=A0ACB5T6P7_AMBMO|nr:unnamed protein product [Ambrosiozyma monospora]
MKILLSKKVDKKRSKYDDDGIDSDDFDDDDDLDEDDKAILKEMGALESSDSENSDDDSDEDSDTPRVKENPYMAPVAVPEASTGKYIPPSVRRRMALEQGSMQESEKIMQLMKSVKGPLNKLSEPNSNTIINELNQLYNDNPRQTVNEAMVKTVNQFVLVPGPMLDSFLILYAAVIVSLYRLQGVEFGAYVIQTFVEKLNEYLENESLARGKEAVNLIGLIGYCYNFNLVSASLIYDIVSQKLIKDPTEAHTALLLKLVKAAGSKMRADDSNALKQIILDLNKSIKDTEAHGSKTTLRTRVLIDTMTNLKNNKLKNTENENSMQMITRFKKQISKINSNRNTDPIQVTLSDIESVDERGKWWLVGSAWRGSDSAKNETESKPNAETEEYEVNDELVNDILDTAAPNWLELAKQQRMNTDIRRAIFISIMSAGDYMDSFAKLEKLGLKRSQQREIPNILLHCTAMEAVYNPYYGFLAKKN